MRLKNTNEVMREFGQYVVSQSRSALTRKKKNLSSTLYKSLDFDVVETSDSIKTVFEMAYYGQFQDQGVSGTERKYNTPYSYRSKKPPHGAILNWVKARKIRFRDSKGRFTRGNYRSIAFVIQNSIYKKGIKPSLFFTRPYNLGIERYEKRIVEAFLKDLGNRL